MGKDKQNTKAITEYDDLYYRLHDCLIHWKEARKNLDKPEIDENTRCAIDLMDVIAMNKDNRRIRELKRSYFHETVEDFRRKLSWF